jgi:hypothetical protein
LTLAQPLQFLRGMQLKILITTLILGSSSVALAAPEVRDHRTHTTTTIVAPPPVAPIAQPSVIVTPVRFDKRVQVKPVPASWRRPAVQSWTTLANNARIDGRMVLDLKAFNRQFSRLALRSDGNGRTKIDRVMILFGNGQRQVVELDAKLSKKSANVSIDLQGDTRNIDKIVLVGKTNGRNASIDVLAL